MRVLLSAAASVRKPQVGSSVRSTSVRAATFVSLLCMVAFCAASLAASACLRAFLSVAAALRAAAVTGSSARSLTVTALAALRLRASSAFSRFKRAACSALFRFFTSSKFLRRLFASPTSGDAEDAGDAGDAGIEGVGNSATLHPTKHANLSQ